MRLAILLAMLLVSMYVGATELWTQKPTEAVSQKFVTDNGFEARCFHDDLGNERRLTVATKDGVMISEVWYDANHRIESANQWTVNGELIDACRTVEGVGVCRFHHDDHIYGRAKHILLDDFGQIVIFYSPANKPTYGIYWVNSTWSVYLPEAMLNLLG